MIPAILKKGLALCLSIAMMVTVSSAFAIAKQPEDADTIITWLDKDTYMESADLPDGSCQFIIVKNGEVVDTVNAVPGEASSSMLRAAPSYKDLGSIKYTYNNSTGKHTCVAEVYHSYTKKTKNQYNINGRYQNFASFCGFLVTVFSWHAKVATTIGKALLKALSIASNTAPMLIPDCYVDSTMEENAWKFVNKANTSNLNTISGVKYTITAKGKFTGKVFYDRKSLYHTKSEFTKKTKAFATVVYSWLFSNYPSYSSYTYTVK